MPRSTFLFLIVLACTASSLRAQAPEENPAPVPSPRLAAKFGSSTFRHDSPPYWATYAGPDNHIYTLGADSQLRIWDGATGLPVGATEFGPLQNEAVGISSDASRMIWVDASGSLRLKSREGEAAGHELIGLRFPGSRFSFSADGSRVSAMEPGVVAVWQVKSGKLLAKVDLEIQPDADLWLDDKGETLLVASDTNLWRVSVAKRAVAGDPETRPGVARLCGHGVAAWFSSEDSFELVDGASGQSMADLKWTVGEIAATATTPDRSVFLLALQDGTVTAWEIATRKQLWSTTVGTGEIKTMATSPDSKSVVLTTDSSNFLYQRNVKTGDPIAEPDSESGSILRVAASGDGKWVATFAQGGSVSLWNRAAGHLAWRVKATRELVRGLQFSPDGKSLLVWIWSGPGEPSAIEVFRVSDGSQARLLDPERGPAGWSTDGKQIARVVKRSILVCDATTWKEDLRVRFAGRSALSLALIDQGKTLVYLSSGNNDGMSDGDAAFDWSLRSVPVAPGGVPERKVRLAWAVSDAAFSTDREMLAIRRAKSTEVWDVRTGTMLFTVTGGKTWLDESEREETPENGRHARGRNEECHSELLFVAWDADGARLASTHAPGSIDIIDTRVGGKLFNLTTPGSSACGAFIPGTDLLATGGEDGVVWLWDTSMPARDGAARKTGALWHLWEELASTRGSTARRAAAALAASGNESLDWLMARLDIPEAPDTADLVKGLGSDDSAVRDNSQERLLALGPGVEPALRRARDAGVEPEVRARIDVMLAAFSNPSPHNPEDIQRDWAVRIIGEMGTEASRAALKQLATKNASGRIQGMATRELARPRRKDGK